MLVISFMQLKVLFSFLHFNMSANKLFFRKKDFLLAEFFNQLSLRSVLPLALLDTP